MKFVNDYMQRCLAAVREKDKDEAVEAIANIFLEVEMEMSYIDKRRQESEDSFNYWLEALMLERSNAEKNTENFLTKDV